VGKGKRGGEKERRRPKPPTLIEQKFAEEEKPEHLFEVKSGKKKKTEKRGKGKGKSPRRGGGKKGSKGRGGGETIHKY